MAAFCTLAGHPSMALCVSVVRLGVRARARGDVSSRFARNTCDDNSAEPKKVGKGGLRGAAGALEWVLKPGLPSIPFGRSPFGGWIVTRGAHLPLFLSV